MIARRVSGEGVRMRIQAPDGVGGATAVVSLEGCSPEGSSCFVLDAGFAGDGHSAHSGASSTTSSSLELESLELAASFNESSSSSVLLSPWSRMDPSSVDGSRENLAGLTDARLAAFLPGAAPLTFVASAAWTATAPVDDPEEALAPRPREAHSEAPPRLRRKSMVRDIFRDGNVLSRPRLVTRAPSRGR